MALDASALKAIIRDYEGRIDKNELRFPEFGMLDQFKADTARGGIISMDDLNSLREIQVGRDFEIPVMSYTPGDYTLTAGKPNDLDPAFAERDSAVVTPTFVDYWFPITMSYGEHQNNAVKYADKFIRELSAWDKSLATQINADCIAGVEAARTQLVNAEFGGVFDPILDITNFATADNDQFLNQLDQMMKANDYQMPYSSVGNQGIQYLANLMKQRSLQNDQNLAMQLGDITIRNDNSIANSGGTIQGTGYFMQDGNTALVENIGRIFRAGETAGDGRQWMTMRLPVSGIEVNVLYNSEGWIPGATVTNNANIPLDKLETWIVWARYSVNTAYNSNQVTNPSPFIKYDVAK